MEEIAVVIFAIAMLAAPVMAIVALVQINRLKKQVVELREALKTLVVAPRAAEQPIPETPKPVEKAVETATEEVPSATPWTQPQPPVEMVPPMRVEAAPKTAEPPKSTSWLEEALAFRWLVWLGGGTLALGGVFFVQYSMEHGLISPVVRIALALGLGAMLVFAGEWFRRRPLRQAIAAIRPDYIPAAITAAGIAILYGGVYAGYALYDLFTPILAFALLTAVSLLALGLSLLQGQLIAALGLVGSYAVPLLIGPREPQLWGLFSYLAVIGAAVLALVHRQQWWWAAWAVIAGSGLWSALVIAVGASGLDLLPLALFILMIFGGLITFINNRAAVPAIIGAGGVSAVLLFFLGIKDGNGPISLAATAVYLAAAVAMMMRQARLERLLPVPALLGLLVLVFWALPGEVYPSGLEAFAVFGRIPTGGSVTDLGWFLASALVFGLFFGGSGFVAMRRSPRPAWWALASAAAPILTFAIVYYRCRPLLVDLGWAAIGLILATVAVLLAAQLRRSPQAHRLETGVGIYAVATIAAISLAATMTLSQVWLSIALVLQLPALAWVNSRIPLSYCRPVALLLGGIVFLRLILLHTLFGSTFDVPASTAWILYGYGIPALSYYFAARWFLAERDSRAVHYLEGFAVAAAMLTVSLEIRYWVNGSLLIDRYGLLEQSLQSASWLASALGFYLRHKRMPRPVSYWGARILGGLALAQVLILQVLASNPYFTGDTIGTWPVFNLLLLAYGVPAIFAGVFAWLGLRDGIRPLAWGGGALALGLAFLHLNLEIRHWFQGMQVAYGFVSDAELYSYSAGWLIFAGLMLLTGFWRGMPVLRKAALGVVLLTVGKVFLWDMAGLTGLYRVASFMGLGASLLLVGFLYQRFVLLPERSGAGSD